MNDTHPDATKPLRAAATLVVLRDAEAGLGGVEVLLLKRAERNDHNSNAWVFPGGVVDAGDREAAASGGVGASGDASDGDARGDDANGDAAYAITAIRECFEESGLLYAADAQGHTLDAWTSAPWQAWREPLNRGERTMEQLLKASGLALQIDALVRLSRWVTPLGIPKRFDTHFFIARAPEHQQVAIDGTETVEHRWMRPADALLRNSGMKLLTPTHKTLAWLGTCANVDAALAHARAHGNREVVMPRMGRDRRGPRPVTPDEPAYAEIGRLDPDGKGDVSCVIVPGVPVRLSSRVIRVTAPNPSVMTGPGTNSYLVGGGAANAWAVVDPGPDIDAHFDALLAAAPGPIRWIFATHTHNDHSPLCTKLAARTGAKVYGRIAAFPKGQDPGFAPGVVLADPEARIALDGADATLIAIHTPGHASNHICYLLEEEATLFTGDHVMQKATVVINPPDGDMAAYVASLRMLAGRGDAITWLAPGHGFLMPQPQRVFEGVVEHRLKREEKVAAALGELGPAPIAALVARVYDDVHEALHPVAERSLEAHLLKLRAEGRAVEQAGAWALAVRPGSEQA
jgi:glyoxylase-like metal-dependent hydrolase (beta-lactamase superfamily II)/8-oxo-dGTP pyrophosphatase MutT (NUDIX family)